MDFGFRRSDTVVVTGAGSGIGKATAILAGRAGLRVSAWDLADDAVRRTVAAIEADGGAAEAVVADVGDAPAVARAFAAAGQVRYLVNNAGPASSRAMDFNDALAATVGTVQAVTEAWLGTGLLAGSPYGSPASAQDGAAVVNIASVAGNVVGTDSSWYSAGKAAIAGYTRHLAVRHAPRVRANAIAPGLIDTPRMAGFADTELGRSLVARNPMRRAGRAEDVAAAVLFLLSPLADYVNGVLLPVDGGWIVTQ